MRGIDEIGSAGKDEEESRAAATTIVEAGLMVIDRMRRTTGSGVPERGDAFRHGEQRFLAAENIVASAQPRDWVGPAADAYAGANQRHIQRVTSIAALDRAAHAVLARQADQLVRHRNEIDDEADRLAQLSRTSRDLDSAQGVGMAMKAAVEMAAVSSALEACTDSLSRLSQLVTENSDELRGIAGGYDELAAESDPAGEPLQQNPSLPPAVVAPVSTRAEPVGAAGQESMPTESLSALTSALGAAGGMIGTTIAPLAATLTGAAGAAVQALSGLSTPTEVAPDTTSRQPADLDIDEPEADEDDEAGATGPAEEPADGTPDDAPAQPAPLLPPAVPSPAEPLPAPIRPPK